MKKLILSCIIAACAGQLKAQQTLTSPYDSVNISQNIGKFKLDSLRVNIPPVQLQNLMAYNNKPETKVNPGVYRAFPDNMPIAVLPGNSKMPVAKLNGNDNMPVVKTGSSDGAFIKLLKPAPATKAPAALFQAPRK